MPTGPLGTGSLTYEPVVGWEQLPPGWTFKEVAAVGVDASDNVYVFNRGEHPVIVFDKNGKFLRSWGEGVFTNPHGITVDPEGNLYLTDDGDHSIRKCTPEGKVLLTIGSPGNAAELEGGRPFNRPTHVAISPKTGDIYISDGYGNSRVHKFTPDGRHLFSWGEGGILPGQFNLPHNIATDKDDRVWVADRENHRVQVFDSNGKYLHEIPHLHRPCGIHIGQDDLLYVGELGSSDYKARRNVGRKVSILDLNGNVLSRFGSELDGMGPGEFIAPHGVHIDSRGAIYVGEVNFTFLGYRKRPDADQLPPLRVLQKFARAGGGAA